MDNFLLKINNHRHRVSFIVAIVCALSSCKVGPNYKAPPPPTTTRYTALPLPTKTVSTRGIGDAGKSQYFEFRQTVPQQWWRVFHSRPLNHLIELGLAHNQTIVAAKATLIKTQQILRAQIGNLLLPGIDLQSTAEQAKISSILYGINAAPSVFTLYNVSVQASYVLDLFGRQRRLVEFYRAKVDYQKYELLAAYLSISSNIVTTSIMIASLEAQISALRDLIGAEQQIYNITKQQFALGGASQEAVLLQQIQLAQTQARLPPLEKSLSENQHALAVLVGEFTSTKRPLHLNLLRLHLPAKLPVSLPSSLVKQRPDIQAASAVLHEASAEIGVATADMLPQITLMGSYGWVSDSLSTLFNGANNVWVYGGQLLQPLFHAGALIAERRAAIAAYQQAFADYSQVVLEAFKNVSDALRAIQIDAVKFQDLAKAEASAKQTLAITQQRFKLGAKDYLTLLTAEKQYQETHINRIKAQSARYTDTAALFQALGGGWWQTQGATMKKALFFMLAFVIILFGGVFGWKFFYKYEVNKYIAKQGKIPITVSATQAQTSEWQPLIVAAGSLRTVKGVNVTTELSGMIRKIDFQPGSDVKKDQVLVELDIDPDVAKLNSLQAQEEFARITYQRNKKQYAIGAVSKEKLDYDKAQYESTAAQVKEQEATIAKKIIRAPFSGRVGVSAVNPGQYLNPGEKVTNLQTLNPIYADFYVPQQQVVQLCVGQPVEITLDVYSKKKFIGEITTINPEVDKVTRNVEIEATLPNPQHRLLPGMFVTATVYTGKPKKYITLPQMAVTFNPYGSLVYLMKKTNQTSNEQPIWQVSQQFILTGDRRGDQVAILRGVNVGDWVVTSGQLKLRNNSHVVIDNKVVPSAAAFDSHWVEE